jgi:hypothetical protein
MDIESDNVERGDVVLEKRRIAVKSRWRAVPANLPQSRTFQAVRHWRYLRGRLGASEGSGEFATLRSKNVEVL